MTTSYVFKKNESLTLELKLTLIYINLCTIEYEWDGRPSQIIDDNSFLQTGIAKHTCHIITAKFGEKAEVFSERNLVYNIKNMFV